MFNHFFNYVQLILVFSVNHVHAELLLFVVRQQAITNRSFWHLSLFLFNFLLFLRRRFCWTLEILWWLDRDFAEISLLEKWSIIDWVYLENLFWWFKSTTSRFCRLRLETWADSSTCWCDLLERLFLDDFSRLSGVIMDTTYSFINDVLCLILLWCTKLLRQLCGSRFQNRKASACTWLRTFSSAKHACFEVFNHLFWFSF